MFIKYLTSMLRPVKVKKKKKGRDRGDAKRKKN